MRSGVIVLIIIVVVIVLFFLGWSRMPDMIANNLSKKLGVAVSIDSMSLSPKRVHVNKLTIGNPRSYSLPKAFSSKEIKLHAPVTTYFSKDVVVDEIEVEDIYLGLEFDSPSSTDGNWTKILTHYQDEADLDEKDGTKVTIKKLVCKNIRTELLFRTQSGNIKKLPTISEIVFTNITTEGGFPIDQLMSSILGQMLKEVFIQQNLNNMIKGLLLDTPGKAVDTFLKPFQGIFNATPTDETYENSIANTHRDSRIGNFVNLCDFKFEADEVGLIPMNKADGIGLKSGTTQAGKNPILELKCV